VGGDLAYGLTLVHNSLVWELEEFVVGPPGDQTIQTRPVPGASSNAGLGWTLTLGMLIPPSTPPTNAHTLNWLYIGPDGAQHVLYPGELHVSVPPIPAWDDGSSTTLYSRDGSYLRMRRIDADTREIDFPNGTIHTFEDQGADSAVGWELVEIRDHFGNALGVTYAFDQQPNPTLWTWTLTDNHGRQQEVDLSFDAPLGNWIVDEVRLTAFGGTTATYGFEYSSESVEQCYRNTKDDPDPFLTLPLLTRLTLPDGTDYEMLDGAVPAYGLDCGSQAEGIAGALQRLTLRTLGQLTWEYGVYQLPTDNRISAEFQSGVVRRRQLDATGGVLGEWRYAMEAIDVPVAMGEMKPGETRTYVEYPTGEC
ncbi:MAG: hypothetical protein R3246_16650, partial [Acidimicrobiia bacterium]|nr:hypothetical protein [Acidimicrobiia bacterium]